MVDGIIRSPVDDYLLATGSEDQTARLWDVRKSGDLIAHAFALAHDNMHY